MKWNNDCTLSFCCGVPDKHFYCHSLLVVKLRYCYCRVEMFFKMKLLSLIWFKTIYCVLQMNTKFMKDYSIIIVVFSRRISPCTVSVTLCLFSGLSLVNAHCKAWRCAESIVYGQIKAPVLLLHSAVCRHAQIGFVSYNTFIFRYNSIGYSWFSINYVYLW